MKRALLLLVGIAALLTGCTVKTIDRPVTVTTKHLPELEEPKNAVVVKGQSCSRSLLGIVPLGIATAEDAYADALEQAPGADTILDYQTRTTVMFVAPFYYQTCAEIHGRAVSSKPRAN